MREEARIVHAADIHIGARPMGLEERERDLLETFTQLVDLVLEERPQALLIAGDLFDLPRPEPRFVRLALRQLQRLVDKSVRIVVAHGEHDTPGRVQDTILQVLETALGDGGFFRAPLGLGASSLEDLAKKSIVDLGALRVIVFPFRRGPHEQRRQYAQALMERYKTLVRDLEPPRVFLGHFSLGEVLEFDSLVSSRDLPPVEYAAMGHVHNRRINPPSEDSPAYAYPGSLEPLNLDEAKHSFKRGPLIVDLPTRGEPRVTEAPLETRPHVFAEAQVRSTLTLQQDLTTAIDKTLGKTHQLAKAPLVILKALLPPGIAARTVEGEARRIAERRRVLLRVILDWREEGEETGVHTGSADPLEVLVSDLGLPREAAMLVLEAHQAVAEGDWGVFTRALGELADRFPKVVDKLLTGTARPRR